VDLIDGNAKENLIGWMSQNNKIKKMIKMINGLDKINITQKIDKIWMIDKIAITENKDLIKKINMIAK